MKHTLAFILLAMFVLPTLSWQVPQYSTTGVLFPWDAAADMTYLPCYSPYPTGPWTDLPQTDLLWADVPAPPAGGTLYYSCRAMYCPLFMCGQPSPYAPSISLTVPEPTPAPAPGKGWGKGGKKK